MQENFVTPATQMAQSISEFHTVAASFHDDVTQLVAALDELKKQLHGKDYQTLERLITPYRSLTDNPFKQGPVRNKTDNSIAIPSSVSAIFKTFEKQEVEQLWPIYREVISNCSELATFIEELKKKNPKMVEDIEKKLHIAGGGPATFAAQIIKVVQTPPRYRLFVDGFIKPKPELDKVYPSLKTHGQSQGYKKLIHELNTLNKFTGVVQKLKDKEMKTTNKKMNPAKQKALEADMWLADRGQLKNKFVANGIAAIATYRSNAALNQPKIKSKRQLKKVDEFSSLLDQQAKIMSDWRNISDLNAMERKRILDATKKIIRDIKKQPAGRKNRKAKKVLVTSLKVQLEMIQLIDKKLLAEEKKRVRQFASINLPRANAIPIPPRPASRQTPSTPTQRSSVQTEGQKPAPPTRESRPSLPDSTPASSGPIPIPPRPKQVRHAPPAPPSRTNSQQQNTKPYQFNNLFEEMSRTKAQRRPQTQNTPEPVNPGKKPGPSK